MQGAVDWAREAEWYINGKCKRVLPDTCQEAGRSRRSRPRRGMSSVAQRESGEQLVCSSQLAQT